VASTAFRARDGQPWRVVDTNGLIDEMSYDAFGALTTTRHFARDGTNVRMPASYRSVRNCVRPAARARETSERNEDTHDS
jgi:YD repeat-containing protein